MKKPTHRLVVGVVLALAASLPRTSDAESVYGTWQGTLTETFEEIVNGVVEGPSTTTQPFTLTMQWTDGTVSFNLDLYGPFDDLGASGSFGAQSGNIFVDASAGGPSGFTETVNLFATYSSIGPDGVIPDGGVTADFSYAGTGPYAPFDGSIYDSFQGTVAVPEPSAAVTMGLGLLIVLGAAWRPRVPTLPSAARLWRSGEPVAPRAARVR